MPNSNKKLWSGRFSKAPSKLLDDFNSSLNFDKRLYKEDIQGSIAYAIALAKCKVLTNGELKKITRGLNKIQQEVDEKWFAKYKSEDIHTAIENRLVGLIGEVGKKLHTGRSRNDQVVTDLKLWLKKEVKEIILLLTKLRTTFLRLAKKHYKTITAGYTHLQIAQPVTLGHYFLAYEQKLKRDLERLTECFKRIDVLPLGSGALAGSGFKIDRKLLAKQLGFSKITENSIDAVSDRDFVVEVLFYISLLSVHLSQWAEEMILWNTSEFNFITISDAYATGSSIMPQKKNPDIAELIRGKTGRFIGNLTSMLVVLKGLPMAYNKDLQEDKELIFDSVDNVKIILQIANEFLRNLTFNKERMHEAAVKGFSNATDVADYLVKKGIPFRAAHEIVGKIVLYCLRNKKELKDLSIKEWRKFNKIINNDVFDKISVESCVNSKNIYGGTSPKEVLMAVKRASKKEL